MHKRTDDILVIDDEGNYAEMIVRLLEQSGFRADSRTNPAAALEALRERTYSLVVSDYKMPDIDGAEFLRQLREVHPHLPVIMVSGYMNTPELLKVANMGVTLVLEKPIDMRSFIEHVRRFVNPAQAQAPAPQTAAKPQPKPTTGTAGATPHPTGANLCAEVSAQGAAFLQALWAALQSGGATLVAPTGCELELVIQDVQTWLDLDPPAQRLAPAMLRHHESFEREPSALTVIDARRGDDGLGPLVEDLQERLRGGPPLLVVVSSDAAGPVAGLPLVQVPALVGRPRDVAFYARRALGSATPQRRLAPEAARVLLNYPWPGNYHELMGALRRAMATTTGADLTAAALEEAIAEGHGASAPGVEQTTIEGYLRRRQGDLLGSAANGSPEEAMKAAGVEPDRMQPGKPLNQQPLLYPEILTGKA